MLDSAGMREPMPMVSWARMYDKHAGHDPEMFRRRFWLSLIFTIPLVVTSDTVMDWFGYSLEFWGRDLLGPILGSVVFWWGGWPFLAGGADEVRSRQPGIMLLISLAIVVAYGASLVTSLDWFDLEFSWELAALVTVMLLGHWQQWKAIGQAQGALAALAELLPDDAERVRSNGDVETVSLAELQPGDVVLVRSGARVSADGEIVDGAAELDESTITGESRPVPKGEGDKIVAGTVSTNSAIRVRVDAWATTRHWPASSGWRPRRRRAAAGRRHWPISSPRCCSTWLWPRGSPPSWPGWVSGTRTTRSCAR
jgi:Cu2+-exporting ATPase